MLLDIQIDFKPQLHAVFILYMAGVNTTNIFTWTVRWKTIKIKIKFWLQDLCY